MMANSFYDIVGVQEIAHGLLQSVSGGADLSNDPSGGTDTDIDTNAKRPGRSL